VTSGSALRRAFLAVVPPPEVLRRTELLADSVRQGDDGLRWTRVDQRHVTLQFLGRVDDVEALVASVGESVRRTQRFTVALGGAGAFPSARRASVLWLGVSRGPDELGALAGAIGAATAPLGFVPDDRPFRAHVTVARSTHTRDLRPVVEALASAATGPSFTVDSVVLFDSETRADGAVHTERARFALATTR
jgi:RNA 2',3'-cyclic 3'-phosphodiesterase